MKTELKVKPHNIIPNTNVFEVWYDGALIATVAGADGPGLRVITRHRNRVVKDDQMPELIEITIYPVAT